MTPRACSVEGCDRPARNGGICRAHEKRRERTGMLGGPIPHMGPFERLTEAALAYADVERDEEFRRAERRLTDAAIAYVRNLPKRASG